MYLIESIKLKKPSVTACSSYNFYSATYNNSKKKTKGKNYNTFSETKLLTHKKKLLRIHFG